MLNPMLVLAAIIVWGWWRNRRTIQRLEALEHAELEARLRKICSAPDCDYRPAA